MEVVIPRQVEVDIDRLSVDGKNPNKMKDSKFLALKKNLVKYGFIVPIITNKELVIADGEHRWRAAQSLGMKSVPVILLEVNEVDRKMLRQVLNKLRGEHDPDLDKEEYGFLDDKDELHNLAELLGDSEQSLIDVLNKDKDVVEDEFEEPAEAKYKFEVGDVWQLDNHRLMCGDATKEDHISKLMDSKKADMILTDPPYGIGYEYRTHDDEKGEPYFDFCNKWFPLFHKYSSLTVLFTGWKNNHFWLSKKPTDVFYWLARNKQTGGVNSHFRRTEPVFIWGRFKKKFVDDYFDCITEIQKVDGTSLRKLHTCPKPIKLFAKIIKANDRGSIVLDMFGGSGTTIMACEQMDQNCYMMELDPYYCSVIIERWEGFTKKKAEKIKDGE